MRFKLHASFLLGLHYACLGSTERAKKYMKKAFIYSGEGMKSDDVLGNACDLKLLVFYNDSHFKMFVDMLPLLHMKHRNFFDNDEVDEEDGSYWQFKLHHCPYQRGSRDDVTTFIAK